MSQGYIYLQGSEEVTRAAGSIREAASEMRSAAASYAGALDQHQRFLNDWLERFGALLDERAERGLKA